MADVLDVVMLFGFFVLGFGVVGVELFMGKLHYRCSIATANSTATQNATANSTSDSMFDALPLALASDLVCTCPSATVESIRDGSAGCNQM